MRKPKPFRTDVFAPVKLNQLIIKQLPRSSISRFENEPHYHKIEEDFKYEGIQDNEQNRKIAEIVAQRVERI